MISSFRFLFMPSSNTFGMKFGAQPWMGCGFQDGWPAAGAPNWPKTSLRSCFVPLVTMGATAGSDKTTLVLGDFSLMY